MANMLSVYKRKVSLALKVETIAKMDKKAETDNSTRNEVAEYILASSLAKIQLSKPEQARVAAEIEANKRKRKDTVCA